MEIPQKYKDLVGTKQTASGHLFSYSKELKPQEYDVLDIRLGTATIMSMSEIRKSGQSSYEYATFELLLKNKNMSNARWTKPFPIPEIDYKKLNKEQDAQECDATEDDKKTKS